tara:strand:- start:1308 stop:1580 length:273 start_codon:yes stop_codon:yes gene_type:complete
MDITDEIIAQLKDDGVLSQWQDKAKSDEKEDFLSDIFNYFLDKNDHRDFDCLPSVAYSIFMHGLHSVDWLVVRDLLLKNQVEHLQGLTRG